jgi:hypothetical protein
LGLNDNQTDAQERANLQHLLRATNHLKIAQNEFELAKKQLQAKGSRQRNPGDMDDPYGQMRVQQTTAGRQYSSNKKASLSDQKTPSGHPNTFLYRAHINLNELNETSTPADHNNVSSFYQDEFEENKDGGELRLKSGQKLYQAL